jgi:hypothetical protein
LRDEDVGKASMVTYDLTKLASNAALFTCGIAVQCMLSSKHYPRNCTPRLPDGKLYTIIKSIAVTKSCRRKETT